MQGIRTLACSLNQKTSEIPYILDALKNGLCTCRRFFKAQRKRVHMMNFQVPSTPKFHDRQPRMAWEELLNAHCNLSKCLTVRRDESGGNGLCGFRIPHVLLLRYSLKLNKSLKRRKNLPVSEVKIKATDKNLKSQKSAGMPLDMVLKGGTQVEPYVGSDRDPIKFKDSEPLLRISRQSHTHTSLTQAYYGEIS